MIMALLLTTMFKLLCLPGFLHHANCKWIDLSYTFNNETLYWGSTTRFQHKLVHKGPLPGANNSTLVPYFLLYDYSASEHAGTHMDAPIHFAEGKWAVDEIPPENLVGDAVVVDISSKSASDRDARLNVSDLKEWEGEHGAIPDGSILFAYTGWGKYWPNNTEYFGTSTKNSALYTFPGIHEDAAKWLVQNRKIIGVGIDTPSVDYGKTKTIQTHRILSQQNIFNLENVANLDKLPATGYIAYALPMKIGGGSGGPVRILATMKPVAIGAATNCANDIFSVVVLVMAMFYII